ncbi:MAG: hypothetical protein V1716_03790 [Candidatus Uhrbacteria bacterium]
MANGERSFADIIGGENSMERDRRERAEKESALIQVEAENLVAQLMARVKELMQSKDGPLSGFQHGEEKYSVYILERAIKEIRPSKEVPIRERYI